MGRGPRLFDRSPWSGERMRHKLKMEAERRWKRHDPYRTGKQLPEDHKAESSMGLWDPVYEARAPLSLSIG